MFKSLILISSDNKSDVSRKDKFLLFCDIDSASRTLDDA